MGANYYDNEIMKDAEYFRDKWSTKNNGVK